MESVVFMKKYLIGSSILLSLVLAGCSEDNDNLAEKESTVQSENSGNEKTSTNVNINGKDEKEIDMEELTKEEKKQVEEITEKVSSASDTESVQQLEENTNIDNAEVNVMDGLKSVLVTLNIAKNVTKENAEKLAEEQLNSFKTKYKDYSILITVMQNNKQLLQKSFEVK